MRIIAPAVFVVTLMLAGCDDSASSDTPAHDDALVGSWSLSDAQDRLDGDTSRVVFKGDGTFQATTYSREEAGSASYSYQSSGNCTSMGSWSTDGDRLNIQFSSTCMISSKTTTNQGTKDTSYQQSRSGSDTSRYSIRGSTLSLVSSYSVGSKVEYDTTTFAKVLASRAGH